MDDVLVISNATVSDAGQYTCQATNIAGSAASLITLVVMGELMSSTLQCRNWLNNAEVTGLCPKATLSRLCFCMQFVVNTYDDEFFRTRRLLLSKVSLLYTKLYFSVYFRNACETAFGVITIISN